MSLWKYLNSPGPEGGPNGDIQDPDSYQEDTEPPPSPSTKFPTWQTSDDAGDITYVGDKIPSRSFKKLQKIIGSPGSEEAIAAARRRNRRQNNREEDPQQPQQTTTVQDDWNNSGEEDYRSDSTGGGPVNGELFDEDAYLRGQVNIVSGSMNKMKVPASEQCPGQRYAFQKEEEYDEEELHPQAADAKFDEDAYLSGRKPAWGGDVKNIKCEKSSVSWQEQEDDDVEVQHDEDFDESDYLTGKIPLVTQEPNPIPPRKAIPRDRANWEWDKDDEETEKDQNCDYDEATYLKGNVAVIGNPAAMRVGPVAEAAAVEQQEDDDYENKKPFNENAYLAGRIPSVRGGQYGEKDIQGFEDSPQEPEEDSPPTQPDNFDEEDYLDGKVNVVTGSVDTFRLPPRAPREERVEEEDDEILENKRRFNERAFLDGRIKLVREGGNAQYNPVAGIDDDEDDLPRPPSPEEIQNEYFDEDAFLEGRMATVSGRGLQMPTVYSNHHQ